MMPWIDWHDQLGPIQVEVILRLKSSFVRKRLKRHHILIMNFIMGALKDCNKSFHHHHHHHYGHQQHHHQNTTSSSLSSTRAIAGLTPRR